MNFATVVPQLHSVLPIVIGTLMAIAFFVFVTTSTPGVLKVRTGVCPPHDPSTGLDGKFRCNLCAAVLGDVERVR